jgi:quercetin dioxygenase-like cupin family protein
MTRAIFIIITCFLTISCNQSSKQKENNPVTKSTDSLYHKKSAGNDSTEIDFVASSPDKTKILLENEYVRVIEYSLKPGEKDNTHTHPPKTTYIISGGMLRVYPENEKPFDAEEIAGKAEWADKRGRHYVENIGKTTVTILVTEIKSAPRQ